MTFNGDADFNASKCTVPHNSNQSIENASINVNAVSIDNFITRVTAVEWNYRSHVMELCCEFCTRTNDSSICEYFTNSELNCIMFAKNDAMDDNFNQNVASDIVLMSTDPTIHSQSRVFGNNRYEKATHYIGTVFSDIHSTCDDFIRKNCIGTDLDLIHNSISTHQYVETDSGFVALSECDLRTTDLSGSWVNGPYIYSEIVSEPDCPRA